MPPNQTQLELAYKHELKEHFGIVFNRLFALTNMPINRFGSFLISQGQFNKYMTLLKNNHHAENLDAVMCRSLLSVDWKGYLYDCDFNQQLGLPIPGTQRHLRDLLDEKPEGNPIRVADHCFACTAGRGSSCGGALKKGDGPDNHLSKLCAS